MTPDVVLEVYKVGGVVLVLFVALTIIVIAFGRFLIAQVYALSKRLDDVQSEKTEIIMNHLGANTECLRSLVNETKQTNHMTRGIVKTLRIDELLPPSQPAPKPDTETFFRPAKYPSPKPS